MLLVNLNAEWGGWPPSKQKWDCVELVCFACVGTLGRIYDVVLHHVGLSAGVVGTLASINDC
jgi:hypothetical protein